ncbi:DNA replication complex GINS protein PSF3 [Bacillus rossius redtenbacheri]|uniref:DNA replication complex GINS protein PSF3 n=1 Tax=Bacillus rossius redtenbacheri TaxID=93214 RepID=UPI002FDEF32A
MEIKFSYSPNYFAVEDILATQERLPCKFLMPVHRLGFLDPSSDNEDIKEGSTIELPYWLASALCLSRRQMGTLVSVDIPKIYKEAYREILKADPCVVDLHKLQIFFYHFGSYVCGLDHRDCQVIATVLMQTFKDRFRLVMDLAQNSSSEPLTVQRLDILEKQLYREGRQARAQLSSWLNSGASQITAAEMVVNHKKRKLAALDCI